MAEVPIYTGHLANPFRRIIAFHFEEEGAPWHFSYAHVAGAVSQIWLGSLEGGSHGLGVLGDSVGQVRMADLAGSAVLNASNSAHSHRAPFGVVLIGSELDQIDPNGTVEAWEGTDVFTPSGGIQVNETEPCIMTPATNPAFVATRETIMSIPTISGLQSFSGGSFSALYLQSTGFGLLATADDFAYYEHQLSGFVIALDFYSISETGLSQTLTADTDNNETGFLQPLANLFAVFTAHIDYNTLELIIYTAVDGEVGRADLDSDTSQVAGVICTIDTFFVFIQEVLSEEPFTAALSVVRCAARKNELDETVYDTDRVVSGFEGGGGFGISGGALATSYTADTAHAYFQHEDGIYVIDGDANVSLVELDGVFGNHNTSFLDTGVRESWMVFYRDSMKDVAFIGSDGTNTYHDDVAGAGVAFSTARILPHTKANSYVLARRNRSEVVAEVDQYWLLGSDESNVHLNSLFPADTRLSSVDGFSSDNNLYLVMKVELGHFETFTFFPDGDAMLYQVTADGSLFELEDARGHTLSNIRVPKESSILRMQKLDEWSGNAKVRPSGVAATGHVGTVTVTIT